MRIPARIPEAFERLAALGCAEDRDILKTGDGFFAADRSLASVLASHGILSLPGKQGGELDCRRFFDDWYLYSVPAGGGAEYGLFKMREQEHERCMGLDADGDDPGVTVSFVPFRVRVLLDCLEAPWPENRRLLSEEIDRAAAAPGQRHSRHLKAYFVRTEARGPYLIAALYTRHIASCRKEGTLPVPERYAAMQASGKETRLAGFLEENNRAAGTLVCDHGRILFSAPDRLTKWEQLAILATHTGNVSFSSFAAEVQFHARFLAWWARLPLPGIGRSAYDSAVRADMSIADAELQGPKPYYRSNSRIVRKQIACHCGQSTYSGAPADLGGLTEGGNVWG